MDTLGPVISILIRRCPEFRGQLIIVQRIPKSVLNIESAFLGLPLYSLEFNKNAGPT